jgi:hypothetical protein
LALEPWVRILRNEAPDYTEFVRRRYVIDVVHREFLSDYLTTFALPCAHSVARRMAEKPILTVSWRATVGDRDNFTWKDVEPNK